VAVFGVLEYNRGRAGLREHLMAPESDHCARGNGGDQDRDGSKQEVLFGPVSGRPGVIEPVHGRAGHCRPAEREGPDARHKGQPPVSGQQPELGKHHQHAVAGQEGDHDVDMVAVIIEPGQAGHGGGSDLDSQRGKQRRGEQRAQEEPAQDD
jgi:hypothetical protein